jgi:acetolactate synthase-1/2/3 large subunit
VTRNLPVKVIIFNNGCLGMIRQLQEFFYAGHNVSNSLETTPNFVKLAEAYGAKGWRITRREELDKVLGKAFASEGPVIVDIVVDPVENVYPMVPTGGDISDMLLA